MGALASELPDAALVVGGAGLAGVVDAADVFAVTGAVPVAGLATALAASPLWAAPVCRLIRSGPHRMGTMMRGSHSPWRHEGWYGSNVSEVGSMRGSCFR